MRVFPVGPALAATVLAVGVLAGCGSGGGRGSTVSNAAAGTAPQAAGPERIAVPLGTATGGEGSAGMVLIDSSGRRVARLTVRKTGREDSEPAWSPDGSRLAFTRTTDARRSFQIYVMRADGTGVRRLTRGRFDYSPAWSPDGRWIAYRADGGRLRIIRPDGAGGRTIPTRRPTYIDHPAWAPGGRIAYSYWAIMKQDWPPECRQVGSACGWVVSQRLDGSARRRIVRGRDAHWSPDGRAIVYTGPDGGVYTAPASGGTGRFLGRGYLAEWSRDGTQIVYARLGSTAAQETVWIRNRDGSNPRRILRGGSNPSWQP